MKTIQLPQSSEFSGNLILINSQHPLHHEPDANSLVSFPSESDSVRISRAACPSLIRLMNAVDGWQSISVCSGWRSGAEQESIYQSALAGQGEAFTAKFVAKPGQSEHQTGLAVDLGINAPEKDAVCPEFPDSGVCRALRQKAPLFGWIERYPAGKERITGIAHEPWHFRYVGFPHAAIIAQRSFALEEYLEYIRQFPFGGEPLEFVLNQGSIYVSFIPAKKNAPTLVEIDPRFPYSVSGNHVDGLLLTEWRITHDAR